MFAVAYSVGCSPHKIKFLQPKLLRVTRCCIRAMNIVQLPFTNDYVHNVHVDCPVLKQRSSSGSLLVYYESAYQELKLG